MTQASSTRPQAIVVGASAGGLTALTELLSCLPADLTVPILVVLHVHPRQDESPFQALERSCPLRVSEAEDKETIEPGQVYLAPPNYHLLVEPTGQLALSVDDKVSWARPSVDVLFESAVYAWGPALVGVILTGANADGAEGLQRIKHGGGVTLVQTPETARCPEMPQAAIATGCVDEVLSIAQLGQRLSALVSRGVDDG